MDYISRKHLPSINKQLSIKSEDATLHTQEHYPYIHFFYYIALAGNLMEKVWNGSDKPGLRIVSPLDNSGDPNAAEITVGSIGLHPGQRFMYLFDYGDEWTFTITVGQIQETEPESVKPYILEQRRD